jgi:hypothetical protein
MCQQMQGAPGRNIHISGIRSGSERITLDTLVDNEMLVVYQDNYNADVRALMVDAIAKGMQHEPERMTEIAAINSNAKSIVN